MTINDDDNGGNIEFGAAVYSVAEDVASDLDMPPYDKALMDGYAVRSTDLPEGRGCLQVIEEVTAGQTPQQVLGPGQATRIMTGAPIPKGTDAVACASPMPSKDKPALAKPNSGTIRKATGFCSACSAVSRMIAQRFRTPQSVAFSSISATARRS